MPTVSVSLNSIKALFSPVMDMIKDLFDSVSIAGIPLLTVLFTAFFLILFFKFIFGSNSSHLNIRIRRHKSGDD